jgi:hypothetical protein
MNPAAINAKVAGKTKWIIVPVTTTIRTCLLNKTAIGDQQYDNPDGDEIEIVLSVAPVSGQA